MTWHMKNKMLFAFQWIGIFLTTVSPVSSQKRNVSSFVTTPVQIHKAVAANNSVAQNETKPAAGESKLLWSSEPFDHKLFIENNGQFNENNNTNDNIIYGAQVGRAFVYFTGKGVIYRYQDIGKPRKHEEKERGGKRDEDDNTPAPVQYANIEWVGANANPVIEASERQSYDYIYPSGKSGSFSVSIYKKITYKNL